MTAPPSSSDGSVPVERLLWRETPFGFVIARPAAVPEVEELGGRVAERFRALIVSHTTGDAPMRPGP